MGGATWMQLCSTWRREEVRPVSSVKKIRVDLCWKRGCCVGIVGSGE